MGYGDAPLDQTRFTLPNMDGEHDHEPLPCPYCEYPNEEGQNPCPDCGNLIIEED